MTARSKPEVHNVLPMTPSIGPCIRIRGAPVEAPHNPMMTQGARGRRGGQMAATNGNAWPLPPQAHAVCFCHVVVTGMPAEFELFMIAQIGLQTLLTPSHTRCI